MFKNSINFFETSLYNLYKLIRKLNNCVATSSNEEIYLHENAKIESSCSKKMADKEDAKKVKPKSSYLFKTENSFNARIDVLKYEFLKKNNRNISNKEFFNEKNNFIKSETIFSLSLNSTNSKQHQHYLDKTLETGLDNNMQKCALCCIVNNIFKFYCSNVFYSDQVCIIKHNLFAKISDFHELPLFLDWIIMDNICNLISNKMFAYQLLKYFYDTSLTFFNKNLNDQRKAERTRSKFIMTSRLIILSLLQSSYQRVSFFGLYSHGMAILQLKNITETKKQKANILLYISFFVQENETIVFNRFHFLFHKEYKLIIIPELFKSKKDRCRIFIEALFFEQTTKELLLYRFNSYFGRCVTNSGKECKSEIFYYNFKEFYIFFSNLEHQNGNLEGILLSFSNFIFKFMCFYGQILEIGHQ